MASEATRRDDVDVSKFKDSIGRTTEEINMGLFSQQSVEMPAHLVGNDYVCMSLH